MLRKHSWNILGIVSAFALAPCMFFFCYEQFELMLSGKVWGAAAVNVDFYQYLYNAGYFSFASSPWTINAELFPNMTAGQAYDLLCLGLFLSVIVPLIILFVSLWTWND